MCGLLATARPSTHLVLPCDLRTERAKRQLTFSWFCNRRVKIFGTIEEISKVWVTYFIGGGQLLIKYKQTALYGLYFITSKVRSIKGYSENLFEVKMTINWRPPMSLKSTKLKRGIQSLNPTIIRKWKDIYALMFVLRKNYMLYNK